MLGIFGVSSSKVSHLVNCEPGFDQCKCGQEDGVERQHANETCRCKLLSDTVLVRLRLLPITTARNKKDHYTVDAIVDVERQHATAAQISEQKHNCTYMQLLTTTFFLRLTYVPLH